MVSEGDGEGDKKREKVRTRARVRESARIKWSGWQYEWESEGKSV